MRLKTTISVLLGLMLIGCSGSQQDQDGLQAEGQEEEQWSQQDDQSDDQLASDEEEFENLVDTTESVMEPVETVATPAPTTGNVDPNRVIRYVTEAGAPAYSGASEGQSIGVFPQGTRLMVVEEGEWSRVNDSTFVKTNSLSKKAVPRAKKKAVWSHPAH